MLQVKSTLEERMSTEECRNRHSPTLPALLKAKALIILHMVIKDKTGEDEQHPKNITRLFLQIYLPDVL